MKATKEGHIAPAAVFAILNAVVLFTGAETLYAQFTEDCMSGASAQPGGPVTAYPYLYCANLPKPRMRLSADAPKDLPRLPRRITLTPPAHRKTE